MKYDILLLSVPLFFKESNYSVKYLSSVYYLKPFLSKHNIKVKIINGLEFCDDEDSLIKEIKKYNFEWLGLSVFTVFEVAAALRLGEQFDKVIYGGFGVWKENNRLKTQNQQKLSKQQYVISGDSYNTLLHLLRTGELKQHDDLKLADRPIPDYSDLKSNVLYYFISEGCINNCKFCNINKYWKKYTHLPGEQAALNSIKLIKENPECNHITFGDSIFNGNFKMVEDFCKTLIKNKSKFTWTAFIAVRKNTKQSFFDYLKQTNFINAKVGFESASEKVRKDMRKFSPLIDNYNYIFSLLLREIHVTLFFVIGYPSETDSDFKKNLKFLIELSKLLPKDKRKFLHLRINTFSMLFEEDADLIFKDSKYLKLNNKKIDWENENSNFEIRRERVLLLHYTALELGFSSSNMVDSLDIVQENFLF